MTVVLTMSTVPNRMEHILKKSITRILNMPEDFELHLNLPDKQITTGEEYILPKWLEETTDKKLKIFTGLKDLGPRTKLIPTLERISDPDTIIITVDDDLVYRDGLISTHLKLREKYPSSITGFAGVGEDGKYYTSVKQDTKVAVLEHYKSVSYRRSFFEDSFFNTYLDKCWNDDIITSMYFRDRGMDRLVVKYESETYFVPRIVSFPIASMIDTDFGGCDYFRDSSRKNTFDEILKMYNSFSVGKVLR